MDTYFNKNSYKLDWIDKKILHLLDLDSRTPLSKIAKTLRISRSMAEYRLKKLSNIGIITAYSTRSDPSKFGFSSWKIYAKFHNINPEIEKKIINFLESHKKVWWLVKCYGNYDILFSVVSKNFYEFNEVLEKFHELFGQYIIEEAINNHLSAQYFSRGYLTNVVSTQLSEPFIMEPIKEKIDILDVGILRELGKNARIPLTILAKKLNSTPRILAYRIKALSQKNIIVFNQLCLNVRKLGMEFYKGLIYLKNVSPSKLKTLIQYCIENPYINEYSRSVGEWQLELELEVFGFQHCNEILDQMRAVFPEIVIRTEAVLLHKEYKFTENFLDYYYS